MRDLIQGGRLGRRWKKEAKEHGEKGGIADVVKSADIDRGRMLTNCPI